MPPELSQLRDLHLPDVPGWWPPAPGWWMLAVLVSVLLFFGFRALKRYVARQRPLRLAISEMERLNHALVHRALRPHAYLDRANALLKRLLIHAYGETPVTSLSSDAWAQALADFLRSRSKPNLATRIETSLLGEFRYRHRPHLEDEEDLYPACERLGANLTVALKGLQPPEAVA